MDRGLCVVGGHRRELGPLDLGAFDDRAHETDPLVGSPIPLDGQPVDDEAPAVEALPPDHVRRRPVRFRERGTVSGSNGLS